MKLVVYMEPTWVENGLDREVGAFGTTTGHFAPSKLKEIEVSDSFWNLGYNDRSNLVSLLSGGLWSSYREEFSGGSRSVFAATGVDGFLAVPPVVLNRRDILPGEEE